MKSPVHNITTTSTPVQHEPTKVLVDKEVIWYNVMYVPCCILMTMVKNIMMTVSKDNCFCAKLLLVNYHYSDLLTKLN